MNKKILKGIRVHVEKPLDQKFMQKFMFFKERCQNLEKFHP